AKFEQTSAHAGVARAEPVPARHALAAEPLVERLTQQIEADAVPRQDPDAPRQSVVVALDARRFTDVVELVPDLEHRLVLRAGVGQDRIHLRETRAPLWFGRIDALQQQLRVARLLLR